MVGTFVTFQVLLYVTMILAGLPCDVIHNWFNQSTLVTSGNAAPVNVHLGWGVPAPQIGNYTYPQGVVAGYKVYTEAVPWPQARRICIEEGGHLAVLNSVAEAKSVTEIFKKSKPINGSQYPEYASIGFHSLFEPDQFVTILDQTLAKAGFTGWLSNAPFRGQRRYCGSLHSSGRLNNHDCSIPLGFICEASTF